MIAHSYKYMYHDVLSILAITIPVGIGLIFGARIALHNPKTADKYLKKTDKLREDYILDLEEKVSKLNRTMNSHEKGPKIEGDLTDLKSLLPELIGSFDSFAPKWLKPFLQNKDIQGVLIDKIQQDPEKYTRLFTKLIGGKGEKGPSGDTKADAL